MKSKTKIDAQLKRKRNPDLVDTIIKSKKSDKWIEISRIISSPKRNRIEKNLTDINKDAKDGEIIVVPSKVLSMGELEKKIKVVALSFSKNAREKILKSGGKVSTIFEEIKKNPEAKGVRILQ